MSTITNRPDRVGTRDGGRTLLRLATAGSVDDGKSTLVGRLLFDTASVLTDTLDAVEQVSRRKGLDRTDLALLTDGLRAEREQGITIDVAYRYFATPARKFILADCPGHVQYTRNTVTGSSTADVIVLLVDARHGLVEQTRRHLAVAALLRVPHVVLVVNKIDLVDYSEEVFTRIATDFAVLARRFGQVAVRAIPVSATEGDNVVTRSKRTPWYAGPTVLDHLESVDDTRQSVGADFRFPIQSVVRPQGARLAPWAASLSPIDGDYRGYAGRVESGRVSVGEVIVALPRCTRATVTGIDTPDGPLDTAVAGQSVVIRIDQDLDVARGDVLASVEAPPAPVREVSATVSWLSDWELRPGARVLVQHGTSVVKAIIAGIDSRLDLDLGDAPTDAAAAASSVRLPQWQPTDSLSLNDIGRIRVRLAAPLAIDPYTVNRRTGAFIIVDEHDGWTLGAAMAGPSTIHTAPSTGTAGKATS
ncbi:MAG: sulfate adenylyltransferase subunit 1 [Propionibacteriaceae bacterium]